ncbi:Unknown protein [Striga hermonthica]|uniref:Uncharacterized protein n=1 Tax=Striga hermonthica TaxID=68872 RepID=A0A9N7RGQ9_STRHE|nr:Unknown protein [Striga hermonthica]
MKASIKFRDEQKPLLRAKVPLNVANLPLQAGVVAGESKELALNLSTSMDSGPSLRFSYRPNDSKNPFSFVFKTGVGHFGSPANSPLTMSAEFNLIGAQNPSFLIHFKPNFGDFSLKKSHSSDLATSLCEEGFVNNGYFKGAGFSPAESKAVVSRLVKGVELGARTRMPLRDLAMVNFRWGLRVPPQEASEDEMDAVVVGRRGSDRAGGVRLPLLVMNKIGIEHVVRSSSKEGKVGPGERHDELAEACLDVKKQLEAIQAENGLLSKALSDLRSDIAAGKMDFLSENHRNKYSGGVVDRRASGDKKSSEAKGFGGEDGSKVV